MREILFRAKAKDGKWYFGDLVQFNSGMVYVQSKEVDKSNYVIPESVGQFTGLTDKNGKKIFEGDIILFSHPAYKKEFSVCVKWNKDEVGFEAVNGDWVDCLGYDSEFHEVIGNIHDNPELLEVEACRM